MRPSRGRWARRLPHLALPGPLGLALALAVGLAAAACQPDPKPELKGHLGPGSGGPAIVGPPATIDIAKANGEVVGYADYDAANLLPLGPAAPDHFESLVDATGTVLLQLMRISGRADTPCRFQAALLARDQGFDIQKSGERKNDQDLDFAQVNLEKDGVWLSLFCTTLRSEIGVLVQVVADSAEKIDWVQVHYVLNTVRKS